MAKPGIKVRETTEFINGQGAVQQAARDRQAARAARRTSYEGFTFAELTPPQKDTLLRDVAIELGLISE
jgi:hypothetical protein